MNAGARRVDHTRTSRIVLTGLWADAALVMAASAYNGGLAFAALGQQMAAGIALGLAVDVGLAVALVGDRALHLAGRQSHWGRALRVSTAVMSLALNCAVALWMGHYGVAIFHAFLPVLLVLLSEYAQDSTLQFGDIAQEHAAAVKAERDAQLAADRAAWHAQQQMPATRPGTAPIPPPATPAFRAVPVKPASRPEFAPAVQPAGHPTGQPADRPAWQPGNQPADRPAEQPAGRPAEQPAGRPAEQPAGRPGIDPPGRPVERPTGRPESAARTAPAGRAAPSGSGRRQSGKPKTDEKLTAAIREMTQRNGGRAPSQYQLRQTLGVGGPRAARLLAELDPTPAGPAAGNGAATHKEHTP